MAKTIAIDGPSASGKSSVSKGVAAELGFIYVDSGALYRGVTWQAIRKGIDTKDANAVVESMLSAEWDFFVQDGAAIFSVDDDVPVQELREKDVREAVADVAAIPEVRKFVVESLQSLEHFGSLVMEGRDIGSVVFPESPYKFYLDADPQERALRRYRELVAAGEDEKAHEVMESLKKRDEIDSTRKTDPLIVAPGANVIDSTSMTLEEVIRAVVDAVKGGIMIDPVKHEVMADMRMYQFSTRLFKLFLLIWHRLKIRGAENIPERGGVLLASNHASFLDPPVVGVGYRGRPVHFMARDTLWNSKFGTWWMDKVGCIPVSRGTGDMKALKLTIKLLKEGKAVSMFPEGTRTEDGELQEAKGGIGFIIEKSGCVVVPAYIDGTYKAHPKRTKFIKPCKVTITYGKPITQEDFQTLGSGREAYDKYAALIMQRIADLKNGK